MPARFDVWAIDQSNTRDETGNGSVVDRPRGQQGPTVPVCHGVLYRGVALLRAHNTGPSIAMVLFQIRRVTDQHATSSAVTRRDLTR